MNTKQRLLVGSALPLLLVSVGLIAPKVTDAAQPDRIAQATLPQGSQGERGGHHRGPDFAAAAEQLGVTEDELKDALGVPDQPTLDENGRPVRPPRPDFAAAAEQLGVTEDELMQALGAGRHRGPDFAAAATQLGVTEDALKDALGVPDQPTLDENGRPVRPPRPDFAAAAEQLGVTEDELIDALGIPQRDGDRPGEFGPNAPMGN